MSETVHEEPALIVFADSAAARNGAGWYGAGEAARAKERARALGLTIVEPLTAPMLALSVPRGRLDGQGKLLLDLVDRAVTDKLRAALAPTPKGTDARGSLGGTGTPRIGTAAAISAGVAGTEGAAGSKAEAGKLGSGKPAGSSPSPQATSPHGSRQGASASPQAGPAAPVKPVGQPAVKEPGGEPPSPAASSDEASKSASGVAELVEELWSKVAIGSLVIAPELDRGDGWWEAVVVDKRGNSLTLRWRDYQELGLITRKLKDVALLHPKTRIT